MWLGALIGLLGPSGLFLFALATRRNTDLYWLSVVFAAGGTIAFGLLGRMQGSRDAA